MPAQIRVSSHSSDDLESLYCQGKVHRSGPVPSVLARLWRERAMAKGGARRANDKNASLRYYNTPQDQRIYAQGCWVDLHVIAEQDAYATRQRWLHWSKSSDH